MNYLANIVVRHIVIEIEKRLVVVQYKGHNSEYKMPIMKERHSGVRKSHITCSTSPCSSPLNMYLTCLPVFLFFCILSPSFFLSHLSNFQFFKMVNIINNTQSYIWKLLRVNLKSSYSKKQSNYVQLLVRGLWISSYIVF